MTEVATMDGHGVLTEPATLTMQRLLPGPIERVWAYLTDSDLRRQWLASGVMELRVGAPFAFVWHNDERAGPPGRPEGVPAEHRMECRILACEPPRRLLISWGERSEVEFALEPQGGRVLLTLVHRRVPDRTVLLNVSAGWHVHLDTLVARMSGTEPVAFWATWTRMKGEYAERFPA